MTDRSQEVTARSPNGVDYVIRAEPAPKLTGWSHGPWRWWSTLTRDTSWWVTVEAATVQWPVLRERFTDEHSALARTRQLVAGINNGT